MSAMDVNNASAPIAVIGMACLFPDAPGLRQYWRLIRRGEDAIREVPPTHWSLDDYFDADPKSPDRTYCRTGGFLEPTTFDPVEFGIPPTTLEATDTAQLLGLVVGKQALQDAGYGPQREFDRTRASVILGVTGTQELVIPLGARLGHPQWRKALEDAGVERDVAERVLRQMSDAYVGWQENSFPGLLGNVVAGRIANRLNLKGTNCVVDAACASSLSALHLALMELQTGRCDLALTGGVDTLNDIFMFMCFSKTQALSPSGAARPFSEQSDGTVIGEGVGMLVLKRLADAERDGDRIHAVIKAVGAASDGRSQSIYAPRAEGQALALRNAYRLAGVSPTTIELVEAHGTGTKVGDVVEFEALKTVYGAAAAEEPSDSRAARWCALGSVKSQIGHTKAAAGAASLIKAVLALRQRMIPATLKVGTPNPKLGIEQSPFYLATRPRPWLARAEHPRRAAVSSFGFGGSNFHAVLEEHPQAEREPAWDGSVELIALSAATPDALNAALDGWTEFAQGPRDEGALAQRAFASRASFDRAQPYRLALVHERGDDLPRLIATARELLRTRGTADAWFAGNVFFGGPDDPGEVAFLFSGQGSQYPDMARDAVCFFPEAHDALEAANFALAPGERLSDRIYPLPPGSDEERKHQEAALTRTDVAQPALGAVSVALLRVLQRFGIEAHAVAGHSFGELVALHAAGVIDEPTLHELARLRGQVMAAGDGDRGAMLAVQAPLEELDAALAEQDFGDVVLANRNAPQQGILSGLRTSLERAGTFLKQSRGWPTKMLQVSAAFHSRLMAEAELRFRAALDHLPFESPKLPVFANCTGRRYPLDPAAIRDLLARQLTRPVLFMDEVKHLYESGVRNFIEVGPKNVLTGLVGSILHGKPHRALALDGSLGRASGVVDVARVVALIAVLGHVVDLNLWEQQPPPLRTPGMAISLLGANYRSNATAPGPAPRWSRPAEVTPSVSCAAPPAAQSAGEIAMEQSLERNLAAPAPPGNGPAVNGRHPPLAATPAAGDSLAQAFEVVRDGLRSMQVLQQHTIATHQRFLEAQERAQYTLHVLMEGHQRLVEKALGLPASPASAPLPPPPPAAALPAIAPPAAAPLDLPYMPAARAPAPAVLETPAPVPIAAAAQPSPPPAAATNGHTHGNGQPSSSLQEPTTLSRLASAAPAAISGIDADEFRTVLLEVVAELTGYPVEMLNVEMDLEADLGIDSIKRLEILSHVQRRLPAAQQVDSQYLGSLRTLQNILDAMTAAPAAASSAAKKAVSPQQEVPVAPAVERRVLRVVELNDAPTGTLKLADGEVWITEDDAGVAAALALELGRRGLQARVVTIDEALLSEARSARLAGLILVGARGRTGALLPADAARRLHPWFALVQAAGAALRSGAARGGTLLASVERLDGRFGLSGGPFDAVCGGLAGLAKTAADEWPDVRCVALDVDAAWDAADAIAAAVADELTRGGPLEVGLAPDRRYGLELIELPAAAGTTGLAAGDVVLITGGARGVTAETAVALAGSLRPTLALLGRSPAPVPEPEWLAPLTDEAAIKRALLSQHFAGRKAAPRELEQEFRRVMANREIARNLQRMREAGARAEYYEVDVRDAHAVASTCDEIRRTLGPIRGLVHGAGVIADHRIEDKSPDDFLRVCETKLAGLAALLEATHDDPLKFVALFSSVSGRFGRAGQADYAMANEVLNKVAQRLAAQRPGCRVVSLNWGPWEGGMVTPALRREFEKLGVPLIPLAAGAQALVAEACAAPGDDIEVVLGSGFERGAAGRPRTGSATAAPTAAHSLQVAFERVLDPREHPFLASHVIHGHPVLPAAMIVEWLAQAALHDNPGLRLAGLDELRVLKGVVLDGPPPRLEFRTARPTPTGDGFRVEVELHGESAGRHHVYARAAVLLADALPAPHAAEIDAERFAQPYERALETVYREILFHGPVFQGIERIRGHSQQGMLADVRRAPAPEEWLAAPLRSEWLADPLALDAGLQLGLLWAHDYLGAAALPAHVGRYRQYAAEFPPIVTVALEVRTIEHLRIEADLVFAAPDGHVVATLGGVEWIVRPGLARYAADAGTAVAVS